MSRLIDADALENVVETALKKAKTLTGMDFLMVTKDQPTIDAIPVEWMRKKIKEHTVGEGWQDYLANSVGLCIEEWQKEQETNT